MAAKVCLAIFLGLTVCTCESASANPIRKVVNMLQAMQKKVEAEGITEKALFDKFMCYCKTSGGDLSASIAAAENKLPQVGTGIEQADAKQVQLKADISSHQSDRSSGKQSIADATSLRQKQANDFAKIKSDLETNIAALRKAIAALEKGMAGGFLQTNAAQTLRKIALSVQMLDADRQDVLAFLSGSYAPQSGEITGILKQMLDSMVADLKAATKEETGSVASFKDLVHAKTKEVNALTAAIEDKTVRSGELAVKIVQMKNDLGDTAAALADDKAFLADMDANCAKKQGEWEAICKTRSEELVALAETIKVLNDDDALELFKKTLPGTGANLLQLTASAAALRQRALTLIRGVNKGTNMVNLNFIALALSGKKIGFEKVIGMIDELVALLKKEQVDDNNKKEYCQNEFDSLDDKKKALERAVSDAESNAGAAQDAIATLTAEIQALQDGIRALDKSVAEATEQRKEEHADYKELLASDSAAKEILGFAKNRLNKFYNPKLYKAPPKRVLDAEDRIVVNMGGELAATSPPGGIAGTGISLVQVSRHEVAPPPPPETAGAYTNKGQESNAVISMIDLLVQDLDKELTESETTEKDSQAEYEQTMADSAKKRAQDSKSLTGKESAKAETSADLEGHNEEKNTKGKELMATNEVIANLHAECDWLLQNFDARNEARNGEIDSLVKAKAVLSGADYSLLQTKRALRGQ